MGCFTACRIANLASRIGGWTIADPATWFLSSMAEVLLRTRQQATRTTGEFTGSLQEYAKIRLLDAYARTRPQLRRSEHPPSPGLPRRLAPGPLHPRANWETSPLHMVRHS